MHDLVKESLESVQSPYSFWYRLFPEDPRFPAKPSVDAKFLEQCESMRNLVEREIENCWVGNCANGNWERSLHIKKILASAGF